MGLKLSSPVNGTTCIIQTRMHAWEAAPCHAVLCAAAAGLRLPVGSSTVLLYDRSSCLMIFFSCPFPCRIRCCCRRQECYCHLWQQLGEFAVRAGVHVAFLLRLVAYVHARSVRHHHSHHHHHWQLSAE
jgi:hypothetical protein